MMVETDGSILLNQNYTIYRFFFKQNNEIHRLLQTKSPSDISDTWVSNYKSKNVNKNLIDESL